MFRSLLEMGLVDTVEVGLIPVLLGDFVGFWYQSMQGWIHSDDTAKPNPDLSNSGGP